MISHGIDMTLQRTKPPKAKRKLYLFAYTPDEIAPLTYEPSQKFYEDEADFIRQNGELSPFKPIRLDHTMIEVD